MRITRCARYEVTGAADYQPPIWTLIEFETPVTSSDTLAGELADSLQSPGWYANWNSDAEATVVFPGRIFRYLRGDQAGREEARHTAVPSASPSRNSTGPTDACDKARIRDPGACRRAAQWPERPAG
jgi:hypothetical protein